MIRLPYRRMPGSTVIDGCNPPRRLKVMAGLDIVEIDLLEVQVSHDADNDAARGRQLCRPLSQAGRDSGPLGGRLGGDGAEHVFGRVAPQ